MILSEETVFDLLGLIADLAGAAVDGFRGASVSAMVLAPQQLRTVSATSPTIYEIDDCQYEDRAGPIVNTILTGQDTTAELPNAQWRAFSERAGQAGVQSAWSLPIQVGDRTTGALNLYSATQGFWADRAARSIARQAILALVHAGALTSAQLTNLRLQQALESRDLIGQAKGILMARQSISANDAFDILRRASQRENRKLRDIPGDIVARTDDFGKSALGPGVDRRNRR